MSTRETHLRISDEESSESRAHIKEYIDWMLDVDSVTVRDGREDEMDVEVVLSGPHAGAFDFEAFIHELEDHLGCPVTRASDDLN